MIKYIFDYIHSLPQEDRNDLCALILILFNSTSLEEVDEMSMEEFTAALRGIMEILND